MPKNKKYEDEFVTDDFKTEVCMYINDCKQYLKAAMKGKPVNIEKDEFDPTQDEYLIIYGMKELKDLAMQLCGRKPLNWKGN